MFGSERADVAEERSAAFLVECVDGLLGGRVVDDEFDEDALVLLVEDLVLEREQQLGFLVYRHFVLQELQQRRVVVLQTQRERRVLQIVLQCQVRSG